MLLTSNDSVVRMVEYLQRCKYDIPIVVLYIVSYHTSDEQIGVDEDDEGADDARRMKIINDRFWKLLMGDEGDAWDDGDDQLVAGSTTHDNDALDDVGDQPMAGTSTHGDEGIGDEMDGDEEVGHKGDGDEDVQDVEFDDESDEDDEKSEYVAHTLLVADQLLEDEDEEEDTSSSKLMRSDILVTPFNSDDDDNEVVSKARCVPTFA